VQFPKKEYINGIFVAVRVYYKYAVAVQRGGCMHRLPKVWSLFSTWTLAEELQEVTDHGEK
jgi:hypothetical protein